MNLQDFSVVNTKIKKIKEDLELKSFADAFYFIAINKVIDLQDDEIMDSITDNAFLTNQGLAKGHDRGIDAIYIDEEGPTPVVHLFNCKYTQKFETAKNSNFPSSEIDKIGDYFRALMNEDHTTIGNSNVVLREKTEEIWELFDNYNPIFKIHLCANFDKSLEANEKIRFTKMLSQYSNIEIIEHINSEYVDLINSSKRIMANSKFRANQKELFEKSDGDIRALIVNVNAKELIRIITDDDEFRNAIDLEDYSDIKDKNILEDIFYDNVRMYKKRGSRINVSIKETAKSEERNKFFYYNNGITITCKSFEYSKILQPVIKLEEMQVVNGSQTLHALFDIAKENIDYLNDIEILCRIYELKNSLYSSHIAEYTNSQNQVTTRDVRSIDFIQQKLDTEFQSMGYFYERKKNQYENEPKNKRIDAEKAGQALMAFYNGMPNEAKNNKRLIFDNKYENVFNTNINAEKVLLAYSLYEEIENRKNKTKKEIIDNEKEYEEKSYIIFSSYYILYILAQIANIKSKNENDFIINKENLLNYYDIALLLIQKAIKQEKKNNPSKYSNTEFFKSSRAKSYIDDFFRRIGNNITAERINRLKMIEVD